ncbi:MAG TPA: peptide-methionine (S)-S-oxide reductase MsrA [Candidatus Dormibacteraeota bacterium]|nr:peptide-methionine (S)-S-oxide reductase MsrA [Candidatus Dormibacteraeota bacterium]
MMKRLVLAALLCAAVLATPAAWASPVPAQRVVLAGGCFWGMQAVFERLRGVTSVVAGYSGGGAATAHYEIVSTGLTGHAESVEITYDPAAISFAQILDVYFLIAHDPTELNRQGPDYGSQYRSEIFFTTEQQRHTAVATIASLERRHVFGSRIVTQVAPLRAFYPAEAYHQDFVAHHPDDAYVVINDLPKLHTLAVRFPSLVKH